VGGRVREVPAVVQGMSHHLVGDVVGIRLVRRLQGARERVHTGAGALGVA
jgi:hypothetical protein